MVRIEYMHKSLLFLHFVIIVSTLWQWRRPSDGAQYVYRRQPEFSRNNCVSDFVIFDSIAIHHLFQIRNDKLMRNW